MVGKLLTLLAAVNGVLGQMATVTQQGGAEIVNVPQGATVIIIATNAGGGASWQNVNPPMSMSGTPQTHQVTVGGDQLVYTPNTINAAVGDYVQFNFMTTNHTVTQSSFNTPCVNAKMFDSGFMPNKDNAINPPPAVKMQVNTTDPQWFYCKQKTPVVHCGKGMTFSINPTATKSQALFQQMAMQQNGTATSSSGSGSSSAAPPPPPPPASAAPPAASAAAPPPAAASIASGTGSTGSDGTCQCSCLCGMAAFPDAATQGMANFGGMSGALPASDGVKGV